MVLFRYTLKLMLCVIALITLGGCDPTRGPVVPPQTLPTRAKVMTATRALTHTATPTSTPTPSPTTTPTATWTPTASPTHAPTKTPSATPTPTVSPTPAPTATASSSPTVPPLPSATPIPQPTSPSTVSLNTLSILASPTPPARLVSEERPGENGYPTLADFWEQRAIFVQDVVNTGLPMGESDTVVMQNGEIWAYLHASTRSAGVVDRCGQPVEFPGCTVLYRSYDGGRAFSYDPPLVCQFDCPTCPCEAERDHIMQQQYPRVAYSGTSLFLVYEYLGRARLRRSADGLTWSQPEKVGDTGIWKLWLRSCRAEERIGKHPFVPYEYECLAGGPPGIAVSGGRVYIFVGLGQNPGAMGCYAGALTTPAENFVRCQHNPLFTGAADYGPLEERGASTNTHFDFRTISSAEVMQVGERFYMLYEGTRGPGPGDAGDSQFGLGLTRSQGPNIDGPWEKYPGNPILVDLPGNIGLGHADLVVLYGQTLLYTSLDGLVRSRLSLVWK